MTLVNLTKKIQSQVNITPAQACNYAKREFDNRLKAEVENSYQKYLMLYDLFVKTGTAAGMYECFCDPFVKGLYKDFAQAPFSNIEPIDVGDWLEGKCYNHIYFLA